jgi:asparagine synthase (glutamine-hydrolysing)
MCGIAGVWGHGADAEEMAARLAHRGPDDDGVVQLGPAHLAVRRLAIFDPEGGQQPMLNDDKTIAVVFNGAIFNFVELRSELESAGWHFRTGCDTEVVLRAFEEWGPACVEHFNGMFGIAVATPHGLFLARDRLGEKPLYYAEDDDRLLFASEIKAFESVIEFRPRFDASFWTLEAPLAPGTLLEGISALPPAHTLWFDGKGPPRITQYWSLPTGTEDEVDVDEMIVRLRDLMDDAVRIRMRADVPVGIYLSGGLDSALVAALAGPTAAYACRFQGTPYDEHHHARSAAEAAGCRLVTVTPKEVDLPQHLAHHIFHLDHPVATASTFAAFALAERASHDVKVVLNGQGADELFGGYVRYLVQLRGGELASDPALSKYAPLMRYAESVAGGDDADRFYGLTRRTDAGSAEVRDVVRTCFASQRHALSQMGATDLALTFPSLLQMDDRAAAAHGLENRAPFLDHRVVELAMSLPDHLKFKGSTSKWILREVARGIVPDSIVDRADKQGMVVPVQRWLRGSLRPWAETLISRLRGRGVEIPPPQKIRGEFDRRQYTALCAELWLERYAPDYTV